ncbi:unnamed protein product [Paramecium octaurelia]|uniref:Uncharacterized protein n=1 Tax=Paramecium octaurelia TaxID=43137 RepID=A0A8S1YE89_PAROT|nr:unnamed protein product [Paramecium octaurelia]
MGNQSEKKIAQFKQKVIGYYFYPTTAICILFLLANLYYGYALTIWGGIVISIITLIQYFCYNQISKSLELGLNADSYSIYLDVLALNGAIQLGSILFDFFWYGYWIIPLILLYKGSLIIWGWLQKPQYAEDDKKDKKKKDNKPKVKYVK